MKMRLHSMLGMAQKPVSAILFLFSY